MDVILYGIRLVVINMDNLINSAQADKKDNELLESLKTIANFKNKGLQTAIVSRIHNCSEILIKAGVKEIFDIHYNSSTQNLDESRTFAEVLNIAGIEPSMSVIISDNKDDFKDKCLEWAYKLAVSLDGKKKIFYESNADLVLNHLSELDFSASSTGVRFEQTLPSALDNYERIMQEMDRLKPVLFFDFDGTLSPIVDKPEAACLLPGMREVLEALHKKSKIGVVSGRDTYDVMHKVDIKGIEYAGSHGFHIVSDDGEHENKEGEKLLEKLDSIEKQLIVEFENGREGIKVDRKRYAIAVHYRNAKVEGAEDIVEATVMKYLKKYPQFKKGGGKKIVEIKPDIDWNKGKAIRWIMDKNDIVPKWNSIPFYFGDDLTDEDAYREISDEGIGILVGNHTKLSAAEYGLGSVEEVKVFLEKLIKSI